jgi:uncharacterized protein (TIGR02466 family)
MQNELNVIGIFPTPIAHSVIDLPSLENIDWKYDEGAFLQSDSNLHKTQEFKDTVNTILEFAQQYLERSGYGKQDLWITQMWANRYVKGQNITPHVHSNSLVSGIIYFDSSTPTLFHHHKEIEMVQVASIEKNEYSARFFTVESIPGRIVLFPSNLVHSSTAVDTDMPRHTVSFNILPRELGIERGFNYVDLKSC